MEKINKHIEIVRSTTPGLSSMSQLSADSIRAVLANHFAQVGISIVNCLDDLEALAASCPDLVFLGMEFIPGKAPAGKIWLSDFLERHNITYTGSGQRANELGRNKHLAKKCILEADLRTAPFYVISKDQPIDSLDALLPFPLFVKPTSHGGGFGIDSNSVVYNNDQLRSKVHSITSKLRADALVEVYLPGREFSVAVIDDHASGELMALPIELVAPLNVNGARLLSSTVKSANAEQAIAVRDQDIRLSVTDLALNAFAALGARDYGRIDIRFDDSGVPYFLEANLIPSLISGYGSFPKACLLNLGLDYESMIMKIVALSLARSERDEREPLLPLVLGGTPIPYSTEAALETI